MCSCSRATSRSRGSSIRGTLGLRLSDRSGDGIAFLHGIHGSDHHMIAFAHSNAPGLHHLSWDVGSVDDIGRGAMQYAWARASRGDGASDGMSWAPIISTMSPDPWGSFSEYWLGINYVPVDRNWQSRRPPAGGFVLRPGARSARLFHAQCRGVRRAA